MNKTLDLKYRPKTYEDLVGQEEAVRTLQGDLVKSYIFTGPSGVGKTTSVRIFANDRKAEVMELDTASLGKADIETLKESAYYKPMFNKEKFIILDEVHNLSKQGWDSLLKVIEEGPSFLVWALITTEPDKIPHTIRTRSRVVEFKSIPMKEIIARLALICTKEQKSYDSSTLHDIAASASGSMREAIKTLETFLDTGDITVRNYQKDALQLLTAVYKQDYNYINDTMQGFTAKDLELLIRVITDYITFLLLLTVPGTQASGDNNVGETILAEKTSINPNLIDELRNLQSVILSNYSMIENKHIEITVNTLYELMSTLMFNYNKFQDVSINTRGVLLWFSQKL